MISENIAKIRQRIAAASARAGRNPETVTLLAVAKTFSHDQIREAVRAGVTEIGENYVQELLAKRTLLQDEPIRWHFVGHLQTNKVRSVVKWIHLIHAVDSLKLAREVNRRADEHARVVDVLIEVNTTGETSKYGVHPTQTLDLIRSFEPLEAVRVAGLMTIGPFLPDPEGSRPMFRMLRELYERAASLGQRNVAMHHLSMGMTGDFEVAIEEGATIVRLGTAIFGARKKKHQADAAPGA